MNRSYTFNLETTKIELHFEKSEYDALTDNEKQNLKSAFLWSRKRSCWVSRAKEPNLWRAKKVAESLGFTTEHREGERLSFAEQVERTAERAEEKADRYDGYACNAESRAEQFQKPINDMHGDIAFLTQPNLTTSTGRAFTRRRERMFAQYKRGFDEYRKSDYFKSKASALRSSMEKYKDKAYLDRRIKECEKEIRAREKNITHYEEVLYKLEQGKEIKRISGKLITIDEATEWLDNELELTEKAMDKQACLENFLDDIGGIQYGKDNIKPGYIVKVRIWGECRVKSTGPKNFTYEIIKTGGVLKGAYAEIIEVISSIEDKKEAHPFKVGERFNAVVWDEKSRKMVKRMYEIIKVTAASIKLKEHYVDGTPTESKEILRKPKIGYGGKWRFSIDDSYGNTFYKEVEA